jgi:hypothetical protein
MFWRGSYWPNVCLQIIQFYLKKNNTIICLTVLGITIYTSSMQRYDFAHNVHYKIISVTTIVYINLGLCGLLTASDVNWTHI